MSTAVLGAAGVIGIALLGRGVWAMAFGIGAALSLANFWLIAQATSCLGVSGEAPAPRRLWRGAVFRFSLVGAVLVLALVVLRVNLVGLVAGLVITQVWMLCHWLFRSLQADR